MGAKMNFSVIKKKSEARKRNRERTREVGETK